MGNSSNKGGIDLNTNPLSTGTGSSQNLIKIVLLGGAAVGKTCLVKQHMVNHFIAEYDATVEDSYRKLRVVNGTPMLYEIFDTPGREEYNAMLDQYIRDGHGFIIVYSVGDRHSFDTCTDIHKCIMRVNGADRVPMVLVGTKSDLESDRVVPTSHGEELAKQLGIPFFEASAKDRVNVDEVFDDIIRQIGSSVVHAAPRSVRK